jgi:predicted RNA-binding protein with PUA-like domain
MAVLKDLLPVQAYKTRALMSDITIQDGSLAYHPECIGPPVSFFPRHGIHVLS